MKVIELVTVKPTTVVDVANAAEGVTVDVEVLSVMCAKDEQNEEARRSCSALRIEARWGSLCNGAGIPRTNCTGKMARMIDSFMALSNL